LQIIKIIDKTNPKSAKIKPREAINRRGKSENEMIVSNAIPILFLKL
jgi:hypothetical protein